MVYVSDMDKKILIVGNFCSSTNGSYGVCQDLANKLAENGWGVIRTSYQKNKVLRLLDILSTISLQRHIYAIAQVDVFSGPAFIWAELSCILLKLLGKKIVLTLHGGNLPIFADRYRSRVNKLLNWADVVTSPSEYLKKEMAVFRNDIKLINNPINVNNYPFRLRDKPLPKIVWLRAFHEIYNPKMAVYIMNKVRVDFPRASLLMIGPDKGDGSFQQTTELTKELGLNSHIEFIGGVRKEDVPKWISKGDIFINTTNVDNTPVTIIEAMACGLCIVSTNVGGLPYLLQHEADALLVPPNDPDLFFAAIKRILMDSSTSVRISQNARSKACEFDWPNILPKWEELLERLV